MFVSPLIDVLKADGNSGDGSCSCDEVMVFSSSVHHGFSGGCGVGGVSNGLAGHNGDDCDGDSERECQGFDYMGVDSAKCWIYESDVKDNCRRKD